MPPTAPLQRAVSPTHYPLTPTQSGILYHRLLDPAAGADVQQLVCTLAPDADPAAVKEAWRRAVARHDVLRTRFRWEGVDEPRQEVWPEVEPSWTEHVADELETWLAADRARGFELDQPPLMRFAWFAAPGGEPPHARTLVWSFHHSLLDGRSLTMLLGELFSEIAEERVPFRAFVDWLQERDASRSEAFWRETLRGFTAPTPLPVSRPTGSGAGELRVTPDRWPDIDLRTLVTGAWALLLGRSSGEADVVVGVAESRRPASLAGAGRMIGMFINTIPARVPIDPGVTARAWLAAIEARLEASGDHEHASLAAIQKWSDVPPGAPLFETLVMFEESAPVGSGPLRDVRLLERTTYPITLTVYAAPSPSIRIAYDRARVDDATARRMAGHLQTLIEALACDLDTPLGRLPILTAAERQQVLVEWNATTRDFNLDRCVHQLFEEQVAAKPDRVAVRFEGEELTYRELDRRANQLARRLRTMGVGPEVIAGILLDRSTDMVAALLGILKAGGAYLPLDPMYPADRIAYMLEDSRAPVVVTQSSLAGLVSAPGLATLMLDHGWEREASESGEAIENTAGSETLAYVIYTSGSTGKPKGVQIPHRAVVNFLQSMREEPGLTTEDALLAVTTLSFDIAGLEIYLPLIAGARLDLVSRETAADGRKLAAELAQSHATVMQATPATWRMLLEAGWKGDPRLKILCGGEAMSTDLAKRLLERSGSLWNMYGPTETTIWSTVHRVQSVEDTAVSIGRPIANTMVYLLDPMLQPVPVGVAGELHIGGAGVARGYLHRPELTAERFIADPFVPGGRIYKTGDAARYLPDGRIEYLNRLDNQVKLRGYRIELGEIEAALRRHPAIAEAVVIVREGHGGKALAAYFIPHGDVPSAPALREFLRASLPEYMVPSFYVPLTELPLTPNGKVDRRALPEPDPSIREAETPVVAPRDALETQLARIWSDVLGVSPIGVRDNFFELGGESLLALRMFVQIEQVFGRALPLATLIQAGTIEALAKTLREEGWSAPWSPLVPIQPNGTRRPLFLVHGVGGNVLNYRALAQHLGPDQPVYALQARGLDRADAPLTRVEEMARLYVEEMRRVQPDGPYFIGGLSFGGVVAFEMALQLQDAGERAALVALFDTQPVGISIVAPAQAARATTFPARMKVHLGVLLHGPRRLAYLRQRMRRIWRKVVYKSWQAIVALFARLRRPLPKALHDVQQANYLALRNYRPRRYAGQVTFFYAEREPEGFTRDKQQGWALLAAGGVISERVGGDHLTMLDEPHARVIAQRLAARLEEAE